MPSILVEVHYAKIYTQYGLYGIRIAEASAAQGIPAITGRYRISVDNTHVSRHISILRTTQKGNVQLFSWVTASAWRSCKE